MDILIDVIIPVYNKESTIKRCINSVLKQTYCNYRIIIIDDGSTDHSYEICSSYKDKRIKLIKQENAGVGAARNTGLENLLGQRVVFIDADDYVKPTYLADLLKYRDYDLVVQGYATCSENGNILKKVIPEELIVNKEKFGDVLFEIEKFKFMTIPWNKLFDTKIIIENKVRFRKINLGEDICFVFDYLQFINSVKFCTESNYCYVQTPNSLSRKKNDYIWENQKDINRYCRKDFYSMYGKTWTNMYIRAIKCTLSETVSDYDKFKMQINKIRVDNEFEKNRLVLISGMLNKLIYCLVKIKCSLILKILFDFT